MESRLERSARTKGPAFGMEGSLTLSRWVGQGWGVSPYSDLFFQKFQPYHSHSPTPDCKKHQDNVGPRCLGFTTISKYFPVFIP